MSIAFAPRIISFDPFSGLRHFPAVRFRLPLRQAQGKQWAEFLRRFAVRFFTRELTPAARFEDLADLHGESV